MIAELYDEMFLPDARVVAAVAEEIRRRAASPTAPGDPRRRKDADEAAKRAMRRYHPLLQNAVPRPAPEPAVLTALEERLRTLALTKHPDKVHHPKAHRGESESIHAAKANRSRFVSSDDDARRVAGEQRIPSETFVDVTRRIVRIRRELKTKRIASELQRLALSGIEIGDVVRGPLDLR